MSILVNRDSRLLVQGITGREGSYHAQRCMEYGAQLVAGVTPGRGGETFGESVPVFNTVQQAVAETGADTSLIFVPGPFRARRHYRGGRRGHRADSLHNRRHTGDGHRQGGQVHPG